MDFQFRSVINKKNTAEFADRIKTAYPEFDKSAFINDIHASLEELSYGDRIKLVSSMIEKYIPLDYERTLKILLSSMTDKLTTNYITGFEGFINLPIGSYVSKNGLEHFELSMNALYELTKRFTSESDIRPFIAKYPEQSLNLLKTWANDENMHVRRLVSEGTRPRLPLGSRLKMFVENPLPVIELLDLLKDDPELYVRRSVANSLNDIAKDNPDVVVETLERWNNEIQSQNMEWITKHALRTLVKQGNPGALNILGYKHGAELEVKNIVFDKPSVKIGESIRFDFEIHSKSNEIQPIVIDYEIHYVKANGKLQAKTFKINKKDLDGEIISISKKHSFKEMSTRKHYPGKHLLKIKINGVIYGESEFVVT